MKKFTVTWFNDVLPLFNKFLGNLQLDKVLEIGSYEGASTCWILDNCINKNNGKITCIDSWKGGIEHSDTNMSDVYNTFVSNVSQYKDNVEIMIGNSYDSLVSLQNRKMEYNFIYIDGGHTAKDVIQDIVLSYPLLKKNGIMAFDDYLWCYGGKPNRLVPKHSIDLFLEAYSEELKILYSGPQVWVRKL